MAQYSIFPMKTMCFSQGELNTYSHTSSLAVDSRGPDTGVSPVFAPFDLVIDRVRLNANGEVYLHSVAPVIVPGGKESYVSMTLIHGDNRHLKEGQIIKQYTEFYAEGGWLNGNPTGVATHCHMEYYLGLYPSNTQSKNGAVDDRGYAVYASSPQSHIYDVFYITPETEILGYQGGTPGLGYPWQMIPESVPESSIEKSKWLDISYHQPTVNYNETAKDIDGVILRIGLTYWGAYNQGKDSKFEEHYAGFKVLGVPVGCYYYSCADTIDRAEEEALYFLQLMRGKQFELPVYYDVENNERQGSLSKELLTAIVKKFCSIVEAAGYYVGYYSYTAWIQSKFDYNELSRYYTLWKADYRTNYDTSIPCEAHQYTSKGVVSGIATGIDLSHCYKAFTPIIKEKGLNGFTPVSYDPIGLKIGYASTGDVKTIATRIEKENVHYKIAEGYIYTDKIHEKEDYDAIVALCDSLEVPVVDYEMPSEETETIEQLKAEIVELTALAGQLRFTIEDARQASQASVDILTI